MMIDVHHCARMISLVIPYYYASDEKSLMCSTIPNGGEPNIPQSRRFLAAYVATVEIILQNWQSD